MRWVGHVACVGKKRNVYRTCVEQPEGKGPLASLDIDCRIILKQISKEYDVRACTGLI